MTAITRNSTGPAVPKPVLVEGPQHRYSAEYKLAIVREADGCQAPGEVAALLRREGLYTSHLTYWRKQRDAGALQALGRPRGRPKPNALEVENARLRARAERAETELEKARRVIEVQGNLLKSKGTTKRVMAEHKLRVAREMLATGEHTMAQIASTVGVGRATLYRHLAGEHVTAHVSSSSGAAESRSGLSPLNSGRVKK